MKLKKIIQIFLIVSGYLFSVNVFADSNLSLSAKLLSSNWEGTNKDSATDFDTTEGGQLGFNIAYQNGRFYTGLNFQGGDYKFDGNAPDQITRTGRQSFTDTTVEHAQFDLIFGYYFWERISLFIDLKSVENKWQNTNQKQNYSGIGFGGSGIWPISSNWSIYGSVGFVPAGKVEANNVEVGDGVSSAFEVGGIYNITQNNRLSFGAKFQTLNYEFDSGDEQENTMNGLFVGYSYIFKI